GAPGGERRLVAPRRPARAPGRRGGRRRARRPRAARMGEDRAPGGHREPGLGPGDRNRWPGVAGRAHDRLGEVEQDAHGPPLVGTPAPAPDGGNGQRERQHLEREYPGARADRREPGFPGHAERDHEDAACGGEETGRGDQGGPEGRLRRDRSRKVSYAAMAAPSPVQTFSQRLGTLLLRMARQARELHLQNTAASLAFLSLLAIVPIFSIVLSVLAALPVFDSFR